MDLAGRLVLTEAATGPFSVTAGLAAKAGAKVYAVPSTSHGNRSHSIQQTRAVAQAVGGHSELMFIDEPSRILSRVDLLTNLGPIRPIDEAMVSALPREAVILLMYDASELRHKDVSLQACQRHGIRVLGTAETHHMNDCRLWAGRVAVRSIREAGFEIRDQDFGLTGKNLFVEGIEQTLREQGATVHQIAAWESLWEIEGCPEVVIHADYEMTMGIPHQELLLPPQTVSAPALLQYVGGLDVEPFRAAGWEVIPNREIPPSRMWRTFGYLGPQPVIQLHAAGLKVGELALTSSSYPPAKKFQGLSQIVTSSSEHRLGAPEDVNDSFSDPDEAGDESGHGL